MTIDLAPHIRALGTPRSVDKKARTASGVVASTGPSFEWDEDIGHFVEFLSFVPGHVNLQRLELGAPLLDSHGRHDRAAKMNGPSLEDQYGVVIGTTLEPDALVCEFKFDGTERRRWVFDNVADGIFRNFSLAYNVHRYEAIGQDEELQLRALHPELGSVPAGVPFLRAVSWTPFEVTLLPIPQDPTARLRGFTGTDRQPCSFVGLTGDQAMTIKSGAKTRKRSMEADPNAAGTAAAAAVEQTEEGTTETTEGEKPTDDEVRAQAEAATAAAAAAASTDAEGAEDGAAATGTESTASEAAAETVTAGTSQRSMTTAKPDEYALELAKLTRIASDVVPDQLAFVEGHLRTRTPLPAVRDQLLTLRAQRSEQPAGGLAGKTETRGMHTTRPGHVSVGEDEQHQHVRGITTWLQHRCGYLPAVDGRRADLPEHARGFRNMGLLDVGRFLLEQRGISTRNMTKDELSYRALHSTGDYALILEGVVNKGLKTAYDTVRQPWRAVAVQNNSEDFNPRKVLTLHEGGELQHKLENEEWEFSSVSESREQWQLETYGKAWGISRKAVMNDRIGAFQQIPTKFGRAAGRKETKLVMALITAPVTMADGNPLYHASHANLGAGALSATTRGPINAGRKAMTVQVDLDGNDIGVRPRYLFVPEELWDEGSQIVSAKTVPSAPGNVNPYAPDGDNPLQLLTDPNLDADSLTAWYLFADPAEMAALEYGYLDGQDGPTIEREESVMRDGITFVVRHDFGVGAVEHRATYQSTGV